MSTLYIVATPIGNLEDITFRGIRTLKEVSLIACEDTRVTKRLLERYEIMTPMVSFHQHSGSRSASQLINRIQGGESVAYVSDAGTPGISDPGNQLVAAAIAAGVTVVPIPGASAVTTLLSAAGIATDEFLFVGFIPHKKGRQTLFKQMAESEVPVVCYESSHRIEKMLDQLSEVLTDAHHVIIGRELTKLHEEIIRGTITEVREHIAKGEKRGEFVVLIAKTKSPVKSEE
jgi:16S rRNA (cytidine1402-2'-O)-methyltransferase